MVLVGHILSMILKGSINVVPLLTSGNLDYAKYTKMCTAAEKSADPNPQLFPQQYCVMNILSTQSTGEQNGKVHRHAIKERFPCIDPVRAWSFSNHLEFKDI